MGDTRFLQPYERVKNSDQPVAAIRGLSDQQVVEALAAASLDHDPYLANVLATEALNRLAERDRLEEDLERSEARHRTLTDDALDTSDVGTFILDSDFSVVWANQATERYFGVDRDGLVGRSKPRLVRERLKHIFEDADAFERRVLATYEDNTYEDRFECHVLPGEGREERWLVHWGQPIESGLYRGGRIEHYSDITERKRVERLQATQAEVLELVARSVPLREVLEALTGAIEEQFSGVLASALLLDRETGRLRQGAAPSLPPAYNEAIEGLRVGPRVGSCGTAAFTGEPVIAEDTASDPRWADHRHLAAEHGLAAAWSRPIRGSEGEVLGTFALYAREPRAPTAGEARAIEVASHLAGIAIERERAEDALRRSEARYAALFESIQDAIIVVDTSRGVLAANPAFTELTGFTRDDFQGATTEALYASREEYERMGRALRDSFGESFTKTVRMRRKSGERFLGEARISYLRDGAGEVTGFIGTLRDVTERERMEADLRTSHARAKGILESITDAFFALDDDWRFTYVNREAERLLDRPKEALLGRRVWDEFPEAVGSRFQAEYERAAATGEPAHFQEYYPPLDVWFEVHAYPGEEDLSVFFRNVTERVRRERELRAYRERLEELVAERTRGLRAANRELEAFAYRVAHDLKAHLRAIGFFGEVLEEDYGGALDARGADYLRRMRGESGRLQRLVADLLAFSRAGQHDVDRRPVDVTAVARSIVAGLREREAGRGAEVAVAEGLTASADPQLLRVALDNLIGNAWKYTANEAVARIEVGAAEAGGETRFFVRDNGVGFPPDRAGELFRPFERLHGGEFEGTGVGLATVKRAVEAHGGRVWAESGGPGEGATFWFTLE